MSDAYEIIKSETIADIHAEGTLLRHKKSGARVVLLANDDNNKVFNIAFRTPPENSTGVAHIIEHTVLCGSRKFPLKDPFVELAKGSLNTFLNAMTYPDKTMYPIASCNDTDFQNLMDVYLDAVFYPNIYQNEKIFRQEGWHYHMESVSDPLTYNGVVYNEMKGAFSSADDVLDRAVFNALFPDTPYGVESGGDPEEIPDLSYEEFLSFHQKYYHPSNSYIYLYGNMDMEEKLNWLDEAYLSRFDVQPVSSEIPFQSAFREPVRQRLEYPILDQESESDNTFLSTSVVVGDYSDLTENIAFAVLKYVLLDAPGAPVKQALLDAKIGKDIISSYSDGILQPFFTIVARNAEEADLDRFLATIDDTLTEIADQGIDSLALTSGINYFEFRFREADYASYPKGLIYGINLFDSWLYDDTDPFASLKELAVFEELKQHITDGYFENLIRKALLSNPHKAIVTLVPKKGLAAERDQKTAEKLAAFKASLTDEQIAAIVDETAALKAYQEEEDSEEAIASLPMLTRKDIDPKTPVSLSNEEIDVDGTVYLRHREQTNGIGYLTLLFDLSAVPNELIPYLGILRSVLGVMNTEHYTYGSLFHEINARTGGIGFELRAIPNLRDGAGSDQPQNHYFLGINTKYLYPEQDFVFSMIREILTSTDVTDEKRLHEILSSRCASMRQSIPAAGHASAVQRAMSYHSEASAWSDRTSGIDHYRMLETILHDYDRNADEIIGILQKLMHIIFRPENLMTSFTAEEEGFDGIERNVQDLKQDLFTDEVKKGSFDSSLTAKNEGFYTSGQVQYVAVAGNYRRAGYDYTGVFRVLRVLLNYDYLWMNLRVAGGAYGCMSGFKRSGEAYVASYRDPHMKRTWDIYQKLPEYLASFEGDDRTMTRLIIGAISEMDTPTSPVTRGDLALTSYLTGMTEQDFQKERDEVLGVQPSDIRALADPMKAVIETNNLCVIGSETVIRKDAAICRTIEPLTPVFE